MHACSHSTLHCEHTGDKGIGSEEEGSRRRSVFPSLLLAETPEHSSAPRPRFFPSTGQPRFQDCVLVSVGCGTQRTAHTYREDHLQVIEHLDLLREAPAAPSHQVVLTVGRGVAGSPLLSGISTVIQDTHWASAVGPTPCWLLGTWECLRQPLPVCPSLQEITVPSQRQTRDKPGHGITNICVFTTSFPLLSGKQILTQLPNVFEEHQCSL